MDPRSIDDPNLPRLPLAPEEAALLGLETGPRPTGPRPGSPRPLHAQVPDGLTEADAADALAGADGAEAREDLHEAISDAQDRAGTDEDRG